MIALEALLQRAESAFGDRFELWLVGDLVNRGPDSAQVLDWAMQLGDRLTVVLGNHDLRLLALACGACEARSYDGFGTLLNAGESAELVEWLAARPLLHIEGTRILVHAGLLPHWSPREATRLAAEAGSLIRGPRRREFLSRVFGQSLSTAPPPEDSLDSVAWATQVMTRLRICRDDGQPCGGFTGRREDAPPGCRAWFEWPSRRPAQTRVFFGHWAMLGVHVEAAAVGLDSGCVYGGTLTALRLEDGQLFEVPSVDRPASDVQD